MTLYSASILDMAKKVEKKKGKKKVEESVEPDVETAPAPPVKEKKPRTEKQIAALERAKEARALKKEAALKAKADEEEAISAKKTEIDAKAQEIAYKKIQMQEKRKAAREEKKKASGAACSIDKAVDEALAATEVEKPKKKRKVVDPNEPPAWFSKYVEGVKKEEAKVSGTKVSAKQVSEEAKEVATAHWNDGLTRDRVNTEVDNHMNRMYHMMFGVRR
jgi:hypothetical protein